MERIYIDTSVFGGYFELEFELWTKVLFGKINDGAFIVIISRLTDVELQKAPQHVKDLFSSIPENQIEFVEISEPAINLAETYIKEKVAGKSSMSDCLHIAIATIINADVLVSWNFKHIVNLTRIRGYNSINYRQGYKMLEIRTPREILET